MTNLTSIEKSTMTKTEAALTSYARSVGLSVSDFETGAPSFVSCLRIVRAGGKYFAAAVHGSTGAKWVETDSLGTSVAEATETLGVIASVNNG